VSPSTSDAIRLHSTGNAQGSYYFLSLQSVTLPLPAEVIAAVHQLAKACKKYKVTVFTDKDGNIINDDNDPEHENIAITVVTEQEINDDDEENIHSTDNTQYNNE